MPRSRRSAHEVLLDRLASRSDDVADALTDAVVASSPTPYREWLDRDCRPVTHLLIADALDCLRRGATLSPAALTTVRESGLRSQLAGVPSTVTIRAMGAAMTAFVGVVRSEAETMERPLREVVAAIATLTARAPMVVFEVIAAFVTGYGADVATTDAPVAVAPLHPTATQVLRLTSYGLTAREVADRLGCSTANVVYHLGRLRRRFGVSTTAALVLRARGHLAGHTVEGPADPDGEHRVDPPTS